MADEELVNISFTQDEVTVMVVSLNQTINNCNQANISLREMLAMEELPEGVTNEQILEEIDMMDHLMGTCLKLIEEHKEALAFFGSNKTDSGIILPERKYDS